MQLVVYGGGWAPEYMAGCHFFGPFGIKKLRFLAKLPQASTTSR
jgi:hypothetical protein